MSTLDIIVMQRAYRFRLYPTQEQDDLLNVLRYQSCVLYNEALDVRKKAYRTKGQTLNFVSLWRRFKADRKERPEDFGLLNATQVQQLLRRQDKAMQAFFRRLKKPHPDDKKLGFPRFKPFKRFRSLEYRHGDGCKLADDKLYVQHVGLIKVKRHRDIPESMLKQVVLTQRLGRWYVCFLGDDGQAPEPLKAGLAVGIDMGLNALLALSDGTLIENPRWLKRSLAELRVAQRALSRKKKGSHRFYESKYEVARLHDKIKQHRKDFWHRLTHKLTQDYALIAIEDLPLAFMTQSKTLARSAADAGLGMFKAMIGYKAESAGCQLVAIDPKNTSQQCSRCDALVQKSLAVRVHKCSCGCELNRDVNAARNILKRARCWPTDANVEEGISSVVRESCLLASPVQGDEKRS